MNNSEHVYNGTTDKRTHFLTSCFCSNQAYDDFNAAKFWILVK